MPTTLAAAAELSGQDVRAPGGLLAAALPAPPGWQRGLSVPFYGCGEPILRDKCIDAEDEAHRTGVEDFPPFPIGQGATCSTLSGIDREAHAVGRLNATSEWALGRQLATDQAGTGAPSLADAVLVGTAAAGLEEDWTRAVGCLEQAAADTGFGTRTWLHAPWRAASYIYNAGLITSDGRTPAGGRWIFSPGYPTQSATVVRIWATGPVWAGVDAPIVNRAVDYRQNEDTAYALRSGIVAFDPCINLAYDITVGPC